MSAFEALQRQGQIGRWGVSNFDADDMSELWKVDGGSRCATNQIYYSLTERGPEYELLPWQQQRSVPAMAYSPIDQGVLAADKRLIAMARSRGITPAQLALAWVLSKPNVMAIPKAVRESHLRENFAAADVQLSAHEMAELDRAFPSPRKKRPLAMR